MTAGAALAADAVAEAARQAGLAEPDCYHCGLPVARSAHWPVTIDGQARPMCCPGCQAVGQTIVDIGYTEYYLTREGVAPTVDQAALIPPELQLYDTPEASAQFARDADSCEASLSVEGIRCAACVWLIERRLARVPGLQAAHMNVATARLYVRWTRELCKPSDILQAVREVGYAAYPYDAVRHGEQLRRSGKTLARQLFVAGLSMMQVMMYAVPAYLAADGTLEADMAGLMRWASLLLTLPVVAYSAQPFFKGAWSSLRQRAPGMDVPVVLGISAAFIGSVMATWRGQGDVYFDSVTMFIFLLLCSRYLELTARRKAAVALERLQHALPASAARMDGYPASRDCAIVPAAQLLAGDIILVKPGEAIAADGTIIEGTSAIDVSLLSGESAPLQRTVGERLQGGAVNAGQAIVMRVDKPARDSTLATLVKLIEAAGRSKPRIALWADQAAAWFVAALLLFALVIFALWQWLDPARAWPIAIAVLVVSCPCALSLATPSALAAATDRLVRQGVLVVQGHVLETLHRATHIIFDKTGTLTMGKPALRHVATFGAAQTASCLAIAAALEAANGHPLALAIIAAARDCNYLDPTPDPTTGRESDRKRGAPALCATEVHYAHGEGVEGTVGAIRYRLGSAAFVAGLTHSAPGDRASEGATPVYLGASGIDGATPVYLGASGIDGAGGTWLARFDLADAVRDDARAVVEYFQARGKTVILLSGDQQAVTQRIAAELGIDGAYGEHLPDQKLAFVQALQRGGAVVAMVGDGINDAAVLRAADVSFAMGSGAALAQAHADTVLLSPRLSSVSEAARVASKTMAVIRQNLAWATAYNLVAIPAAAMGWINPWMSGVGMSLSSAIVIANALRLRRIPRSAAAASSAPAANGITATPP
jgi:P-type Cu2+ transporter